MIVMLKKDFDGIKDKYSSTVITTEDAFSAIRFTYDLMIAEADYIKRKEPNATTTISEIEAAACNVFSLLGDIEDKRFDEE